MGDSGNFSGLKVLAIILVVIVILAIAYFTTIDGIVETIKTFFKELVSMAIEEIQKLLEAAWDTIMGWLGKSTVKNRHVHICN